MLRAGRAEKSRRDGLKDRRYRGEEQSGPIGWRFLKRYTMIANVQDMLAVHARQIAEVQIMLEVERRGRARRLNKNILLSGVLVVLFGLAVAVWIASNW